MKIFLTGGTGFIGKNFIKLALKEGIYIFATTRKKKFLKHKNLKWLRGDFSLNWRELASSDVLVHLAAEGVVFKKKKKMKFLKLIYLNQKNFCKMQLNMAVKKGLSLAHHQNTDVV
jgi:nucleoside-diphosphate-sugar epimerase